LLPVVGVLLVERGDLKLAAKAKPVLNGLIFSVFFHVVE
jgi:hypothetical protein